MTQRIGENTASVLETSVDPGTSVLCAAEAPFNDIEALLGRYGLMPLRVEENATITGSYWGESEAGLKGRNLYFRADTPLHSILHEAAHFICMDEARRLRLDCDAGGDFAEEDAVCYLQVLLSDLLPCMGRQRMFADMDSWGYTFRLG